MTLWADPDQTAAKVADCKREKLPFKDPGAVELTRAPWTAPQPLARLADAPKEAFALNPTATLLRTLPDGTAMLGTVRGPWAPTYDAPLPAPSDGTGDLPPGVLVVDPKQADEARRRFRDLESAVHRARKGDTILIGTNTPQDVEPIELRKRNANLTIQAMDGFHPVLRLDSDGTEAHAALVTVFDGAVTFKNLHFHLKPGASDKAKTRAVVALAGAGQCTFQNCTATLEEGNGVQFALVAVTTDPDTAADAAAADPVPKIRIKQTFIRGKGDVVMVRGSRPFDLDMENSLAALDGSVVNVLGQAKDAPAAPLTVMAFRKVTACLNDAFLELRAAEGDRKAGGLTPAQVRCDDCLFVATGDNRAFVHAVGVEGEALKQVLTAWEGRGNVYGNYAKMLHQELPAGAMTSGMMMPADWTAKNWRDNLTHEPEDAFRGVTLWRAPSADRPFTAAQPADFRAKFTDMKRGDAPDGGAVLTDLPRIDDE